MPATTRAARETSGVLPYVPAARDPLRLSQAAVNAVDAIGERTAKELEASADELERQAKETASYLRRLATGMRKFSQEAQQQVSEFCLKNEEVLSTIQGLEQKIKGQQPIEVRPISDAGDPIPKFMQEGPAEH
jgi:aryl-alcohol dehydrogenase-like predicted oxidoreductase